MRKPIDAPSNKKYGGFQGLCSTCNNSASCTFPRNLITFIWQCDEFDNSTPEKPVHKAKRPDVLLTNHNSAKNQGLCVNCENRDSCTHTTIEGGIWHCEDYL